MLSVPGSLGAGLKLGSGSSKSSSDKNDKKKKENESSGSATGNPRNKTALKPGRSLMDWIRLGKTGQDLTGVGGKRLQVTREELAKHNTQEDAWMAVRGYVFNVTPYMEYHPGGITELMRGVGTDATDLFDEVHNWVNFQSMLKVCLVGRLVDGPGASKATEQKTGSMQPPAIKTTAKSDPNKPSYNWNQTDTDITVIINTKCKKFQHENIIIDRSSPSQMRITSVIQEYTYAINLDLVHELTNDYNVSVDEGTGKVEILCKKTKSEQWANLGKPRENHDIYVKSKQKEVDYRKCKISSVTTVTHDTNLYCVTVPTGTRMCVPLGYHVHIKTDIEGMEVTRSYTVVPKDLNNPVKNNDGKEFYLMIKIYPDGALTPIIGNLKKEDEVEVSSPQGDFDMSRYSDCTDWILCAAGTGFTPMAAIMQDILVTNSSNKGKLKKVTLLFYNKTEADIMWREQITTLQNLSTMFNCVHILSQADDSWDGPRGRINQDQIQEYMPKPSKTSRPLLCVCGPTPFTEQTIKLAKDFGYKDNMIHAFVG